MQTLQETNIYLLADWEKDVWKKIYFTVGKKGNFQYTFDRSEANQKTFTYDLGEIKNSILKIPKRKRHELLSSENQDDTNDSSTTKTTKTGNAEDAKRKRAASQDRGREVKKEPRINLPPGTPTGASRRRSNFFGNSEETMLGIKVFNQDKDNDAGYDSAIDEKKEPFYMKLMNTKGVEVCQLRCTEQQPLKNLRD